MLIDDYFDYQIKYQCKYGERTIVLMQVGSFLKPMELIISLKK